MDPGSVRLRVRCVPYAQEMAAQEAAQLEKDGKPGQAVKKYRDAIILLDQFSRNIFRGSAKAFEADPLALELAFEALDRGWADGAPEDWREFLLIP